MAKQMTITIETDSLLILRGRSTARAWCPLCGDEVEMIALQNMGATSSDSKALDDWLKSGALHHSDRADGSTVICLNSLLARVPTTTNQPPASERDCK